MCERPFDGRTKCPTEPIQTETSALTRIRTPLPDRPSDQAIGQAAIQQGHKVLYRETHILLEEVAGASTTGQREQYMEFISGAAPPIIDDFGMRKLPHTTTEDLLEIVMRRYERASTMLTSNRYARPAPPSRPCPQRWTAKTGAPKPCQPTEPDGEPAPGFAISNAAPRQTRGGRAKGRCPATRPSSWRSEANPLPSSPWCK